VSSEKKDKAMLKTHNKFDKPFLRLSELNANIKTAIESAFPLTYWVVAEVSEVKVKQSKQPKQDSIAYIELVEKEDIRVLAKITAICWPYTYRMLSQKFEQAAKEPIKAGMKLLMSIAVTFHELYGLSLNIKDIDPSYTIGDKALKKIEVIDRLKKEGIFDLNKKHVLPICPQSIAVITAPDAAGYRDFFVHIEQNQYGYKVNHVLFSAIMQGASAEQSIIAALNKIEKYKGIFDMVIIIRGGGSAVDLDCYDSYGLAAQVARFSLPVVTGIGHEKDESVVDMVAHTKCKTPTDVAGFVISGMREYEEKVINTFREIKMRTEKVLTMHGHRLQIMQQKMASLPARLDQIYSNLVIAKNKLIADIRHFLQAEMHRIEKIESSIKLTDPINVLKRGYSITYANGKVVSSPQDVADGEMMTTKTFAGNIVSVVTKEKEAW
jgi:exodeoxyribonuclease VII large subunit